MAHAPIRPRNMLYTSIAFLALGGLMLYSDSEFKYSLIGWVPAISFFAVFLWALITEKRF